jgi:hypothetical protein
MSDQKDSDDSRYHLNLLVKKYLLSILTLKRLHIILALMPKEQETTNKKPETMHIDNMPVTCF